MPAIDPTPVRPGDRVQVWNRYLDTWAGDFEVVEQCPEGFKVRRRSERVCLPGLVRPDRLRATRPGLRSPGWSV